MKGWLRATGVAVGACLGLSASAFAADGAVLAHAPAPGLPGLVDAAPDAAFAPGQLIVRFRDGVDQAGRIDTLDATRVRFRKALPLRGALLVAVPAGETVASAAAALRRDPRVAYAEPNYLRRPAAVPADRLFPQEWALQNTGQSVGGVPAGTPGADVHAAGAWDITTGSPSLTIAVVDTGIDPSSPDLAGRIVGGQDFVPATPDGDPFDPAFHSHGTWVSGVIAANADAPGPGSGMTGIDWHVKIMPLRVFDERGLTTTDRIVSAFDWAATHGARIVNASFSGTEPSAPESDAIAAHPDVLFVVAAGNANSDVDSPTTPAYPCAYKLANILCVAATDQNDGRASFSNWGQKSVDVAAPGYNILTTSVKPKQVYPVPPAGVDTFSTMANWTAERTQGGKNQVNWGVEQTPGPLGPKIGSLSDSPGTNYQHGTDTWARNSTALDLSGKTACHVTYDREIATGDGDVFSIETTSTADATAPPIPPPAGAPQWFPESAVSGTSGWLTGLTTELANVNGKPFAWLRFRLDTTNGTTTADGVHLANVSVSCGAPASDYIGADDEYLLVDGTSFSAPIVSGIASLVLSVDPSMTPLDVKNRIIATSDLKLGLTNLTVSDGRVDANAAVRMAPAITPGGATVAGETEARVSASVRARRQASSVFVELGTTPAYGDTRQVPVTVDPANTGDQPVTMDLTGLAPGTTYHYRFRAVNPTGVPSGIEVGPDQTFTTAGTAAGGAVGQPVPPPAPPPAVTVPPVTAKTACSGLKGARLAACTRAQKLKRAIAACNKAHRKNAKQRATCIRRQRALSACQVKKGKARAVCLAKARRIR